MLKVREYIKDKMQNPLYNLAFISEVKAGESHYIIRISLPSADLKTGALRWLETTFSIGRYPPFEIEMVTEK